MAEKTLNTRIQHKHDTAANWQKATSFVPKEGEIIIYDKDANYSYQRIKIGDGTRTVTDLPFIITKPDWNENDETSPAYVKNRTHWAISSKKELYPETLLTPMAPDEPMAPFATAPTNMPVVGDTAKIVWNGVDYTCTGVMYSEDGATNMGVMFGNAGAMIPNAAVTDEPFLFIVIAPELVADLGAYAICVILDGSTTVTFSANIGDEVIHKIDEKFLPIQKTHWVNEEDIAVYEDVSINLDGNGEGGLFVRPKMEFIPGVTYKIMWDGTEYEATCTAANANNPFYKYSLGVENVFSIQFVQDSLIAQLNGIIAVVGSTATGEAKTILFSAAEPIGIVHKLDEKFLPDTIVKTSDLDDYTKTSDLDGYATEEYVEERIAEQIAEQIATIDFPVDSVNGKTGAVVLNASDIGADVSGAANTALTNAKSYTDAEIAEWVGDTKVSEQISAAVANKVDNIAYGTCSSQSKIKKIAYIDNNSNWKLTNGVIVVIKFLTEVNSNATLNINDTGEKDIYYNGKVIDYNFIQSGDIATFVYFDQYHLISIDNTAVISLRNGSSNGSLMTAGAEKETSDYIIGIHAFAEGSGTKASGDYSHAEGNYTIAEGGRAHAEGDHTLAFNFASHAEGSYTVAQGVVSHAEGDHTITALTGERGQHVQGRYNIGPSPFILHVVGNGSAEDARSNAHTLDRDGNAWFAGDVYVGSTSGTNRDEGSKKLATEDYVKEYATAITNAEIDAICGA